MRFVFHVGMGKTGTSTIQAALDASAPELAWAGFRYLGMWMEALGPAFAGPEGFAAFLALDGPGTEQAADRFVAHAARIAEDTGEHTFVHSNENHRSIAFLKAMAARADTEVLLYVRAPAAWLPSAHVQWGIVHKYLPGPVAPFAETGRFLMSHYAFVRRLLDALPGTLAVRPYPEGGDVLADLSAALGVALRPPPERVQTRPSDAEVMLRAAFNGAVHDPQLPSAFDWATGLPPKPSPQPRASDKHAYLFDQGALPAILEENRELLDDLGERLGLDLGDPGAPARPPSFEELADGLLGYLVDLTSAQARQIGALRARLRALEARLKD